jgi:hypothetical protein
MIDVELGLAQVEERRAADESYGLNGLNTNLKPPAPPPAEPGAPLVGVIPDGEPSGTSEAIIKAEKAKQSILLTDRLNAEARSRNGKYMDAQEARGEMIRVADEMLKIWPRQLFRYDASMPSRSI